MLRGAGDRAVRGLRLGSPGRAAVDADAVVGHARGVVPRGRGSRCVTTPAASGRCWHPCGPNEVLTAQAQQAGAAGLAGIFVPVPSRLVLPGPAHWRPAPEKIVFYAGDIAETF